MSTSMTARMKEEFSSRAYSNKIAGEFDTRCDKHGTLWLYVPDTGLWSNNGERLIEQILRTQCLTYDHIRNQHVKEIIADLKSLCFKNKEFPLPDWHLIPFDNGAYNLKTREFSNCKPEYNFTSKLPVNYNPDSQGCPFIDSIFKNFVPPADLSVLYELAAYCMVPTYANQEVYFLLGSGRNGKSIYAYILTQMLSKQNVSAVSLHDFQSSDFLGAELHGKFANISSELKYNDLNNTDQIKKLSGGDLIQAQRKFQQPFKFENFAKLIFVTNELPRTMDKTLAFYRRVRIIKFPYVFEGKNEDKLLKDKITMKELNGLASKCIPIIHEMMDRNFTFTNQKATQDVAKEYEEISNPMDTFIQEHCEHDADGFIVKTDFKEKLDAWLRNTGQRVRTDKEIAQYMKDKGIDDKKRTLSDGDRKNSWLYIKWKV